VGRMIPPIGIAELTLRFEVLLLDAYGVLVDARGPLPGASELVASLNRMKKSYLVVTNDASRSPARTSERLRSYGIDASADRVLTSGSLLVEHFRRASLVGAGCIVLGPEDSEAYVRDAGGVVLPLFTEDVAAVRAIVVGDESGFPFLEGIDRALTVAYRRLDRREPLHLVLPNPDLVYPKATGAYGFAAGSIAEILECALRTRYPDRLEIPRFVRLGKPNRAIFDEAHRRTGSMNMVMLGDQIETDVRGAKAFGIAAALVTTGVTNAPGALESLPEAVRPDFLLESITPP
jgi:glycerol-1-phosphatase